MAATDYSRLERPFDAAAMSHPLYSNQMTLPTKPIEELLKTMRNVVSLREQGCCFSAISGYGKSRGFRMARSELSKIYVGLPIHLHVIENQQVPSIRAFFKHFLHTVGVPNIAGETYDLRIRLLNRLEDEGRSSPFRTVVILIDEAQGMAKQDFCFLKDLGNQLDIAGIQLVVIMMGQDPDFSISINKLRDEGRLDLVSRFALRQLRFRGLQTKNDIGEILAMIDSQVYPSDTTCTWTQFFAQRAWGKGFRLASQTDLLINAIDQAIPEVRERSGVSARQLFLAIRWGLAKCGDFPELRNEQMGKIWQQAMEYALIQDATYLSSSRRTPGRGARR